ncbi:hypothetical protein CQ065_00735 [Pseudomonas sp. MYb187]|uniref:DUF4381 family protein n=1 Tax=Pseudomonas TaxID=286 RepID=UPI000CFB3B41|nr:DUF4381 family protein [Pseudomonas sp. MYb187]PRA72985.1 hypothetical protein CQ065_00735 [Pseudomonas sp. MYb187]
MSTPMRSEVPGMDLPDLAELVMPTPVSLFPQTLAWQLLLAAIVLVLLIYLLVHYRRYVRRRWRRQAVSLASAARVSGSSNDWFVLIKRVCLLHMPRGQVAALDDDAVLARLTMLDESARQALLDRHYRHADRLTDSTNEKVADAFDQWLKGLPDAR